MIVGRCQVASGGVVRDSSERAMFVSKGGRAVSLG